MMTKVKKARRQVQQLPQIRITMAGPSGTGKSSLLAAMYDQMRKEILEELGWSFTAEAQTLRELNKIRDQLKQQAEAGSFEISMKTGVVPSRDKVEYKFTITIPPSGNEAALQLEIIFTDLPGGWYTDTNFSESDELVKDSDIIVLAVDATALMECDGKFNDYINMPALIGGCLERNLAVQEKKTPVIFTLMKSEAYFQENRLGDLAEAAKHHYSEPFAFFLKNEHPIFGCAVQTLGGVRVNVIRNTEDGPVSKFIKAKPSGYRPEHCSIPLRLLFKEALLMAKGLGDREPAWWERALMLCKIPTGFSKAVEQDKRLQELADKVSSKLNDPNVPLISL